MKTSREDLLVIAFKLFLTKGYAQTSMVDLSQASGLSKGAFHHYFPRKQDIYDACVAFFFEDFLADPSQEADQNFDDFARQSAQHYGAALKQLLEFDVPLAAYQSFLWSLIRDSPQDFQARQDQMLAKTQALYSKQFGHATTPQDAQNAALDLFAVIEGTGTSLSLNPQLKPEDVEPAFERAIERFLARSTMKP